MAGANVFCHFLFHQLTIRIKSLSLLNTGCGSAKNSSKLIFLLSPFTIFAEHKMRLGRKFKQACFLLSPFTIFAL
jgi:hypothetical protein